MHAIRTVCCLLVVGTSLHAGQQDERSKLSIAGLTYRGEAHLSSTAWDIGDVGKCFDGDPSSLARSAAVNPAQIQIAFTEAQTIGEARVLVGQPGFSGDRNAWWLEAADNTVDLASASGSYRFVVPKRDGVQGTWDNVVLPDWIDAKVWRFSVERTLGDDHVHIWELELWTKARESELLEVVIAVPFPTTAWIQWEQAESPDIVEYRIFRLNSESGQVEIVRSVGPRGSYTDYGLEPETAYQYVVAGFTVDGIQVAGSAPVSVTTLPETDGYLRIANLDVLIPIYLGEMEAAEAEAIRKGTELARLFYYRHSQGLLNLDLDFRLLSGPTPPTDHGAYHLIEADLLARGVRKGQYDGVHTFSNRLAGCWGGFVLFDGSAVGSMGRNCGVPFPAHDPGIDYTVTWAFTHEFGHALDRLADMSGHPEMLFNHFPWAFPLPEGIDVFDAGQHFDGMGMVLRLFDKHLDYAPPWDGYIEVLDSDQDGLPDDDPRVPMDEVRFGSSPLLEDTDGDGLSDLDEFLAGLYRGSDPLNPDTDGDGLRDGVDPFPLSNFTAEIPRIGDVVIDGHLSEGEEWHRIASNPEYAAIPGLELSLFANWDDAYLYFAFQSSHPLKYLLGLDLSGEDGAFFTPFKFQEGDYTGGMGAKWYGDTYDEDALLVFRQDSSQAFLRKQPVPHSLAAGVERDGLFTLETRIPHHLGPGRGYSYVPPDAPVIETVRLLEGQVIGIELMARRLEGTLGVDPDDWFVPNGWATLFEQYRFYDATLIGEGSGIDREVILPRFDKRPFIAAVYPNPFGGSTTVEFEQPEPGRTRIQMVDLLGRHLRTLDDTYRVAGVHRVVWDGADESGRLLPSGVYLMVITREGEGILSRPMVLRR